MREAVHQVFTVVFTWIQTSTVSTFTVTAESFNAAVAHAVGREFDSTVCDIEVNEKGYFVTGDNGEAVAEISVSTGDTTPWVKAEYLLKRYDFEMSLAIVDEFIDNCGPDSIFWGLTRKHLVNIVGKDI